MTFTLIDDVSGLDLIELDAAQLVVHEVNHPGPLLDCCHDLLLRVFDPSVVDSKSAYVESLDPQNAENQDFPPIYIAALLRHGDRHFVAGFVSADLMWFGQDSSQLVLAIGNIATSPLLREVGFRGVGTFLWKATIATADDKADAVGSSVRYLASEAEGPSLPFWMKLGYRWPEGVKYWQPPLEFSLTGEPLYEEVPETLLIHTREQGDEIDATELREIIKAIYLNWCIKPGSGSLSEQAMKRVEEYVMQRVYGQTVKSIPERGSLALIEVTTPSAM